MKAAEFNAIAERANASTHVDHFEALRRAVSQLRKGTPIGVSDKRSAVRLHGRFYPAVEQVIPAILVSFDGDAHVTACETDEAHRMRFGFAAAKTTPKQTTEVWLYNLRAVPGTRFRGAGRRRS